MKTGIQVIILNTFMYNEISYQNKIILIEIINLQFLRLRIYKLKEALLF